MAKDIRVYTLDEVADILGVGRRTVYNYVRANQIKAVKIGRAWRVTDKALADFVKNGTTADYRPSGKA